MLLVSTVDKDGNVNLCQKIEMMLCRIIFLYTTNLHTRKQTMTRFHQTIAPIDMMMTIWFKLSIGFGIITFFEMLLQAPDANPHGYHGWANMTEAYKNWTDRAVCQASPVSQFVHEYPEVSEVVITSIALFILGALRAGVHIILPYYLTTTAIGVWTS